MDRLLREGNPPAGQLASPKPQYKDVQTNNWEELKGEGGASYVKDKAVLAKLADLESELATIKVNQLSGDQKIQLTGSNLTLRQTIATGAKTIASTAAEIFAGSSRLAGRHAMVITNGGVGHVYIGASGVTTNNGFPLFPGDTIRIDFNPESNVPVFAVSDGANVNVRVVELA